MTIAMTGVYVKHERRLRLLFSVNLSAAAFTTLSFYTVANQDGAGISPNVTAALIVPNTPNCVELSLDQDLVDGALYRVSAVGVPGVDTTVTPGGTGDIFRPGASFVFPNVEVARDDTQSLLYGIDLVHNGVDFVEGADGDLQTVNGLANAQAAVQRRLMGSPLPWDPTYSPNLRAYVDGSSGALASARGIIVKQALADDRVNTADVTLSLDPLYIGNAYFTASITLIGAAAPIPVKVYVPAA